MRETGLVALTFPGSGCGQPVQCDGVTTGQWPQSGRYKYTAGASAWCRVLACLAPGVLGRASNEHSRSCTGCCKTSGQLWKPVTDAFFEVFLMFLDYFDCQLWAIFHFGTPNA